MPRSRLISFTWYSYSTCFMILTNSFAVVASSCEKQRQNSFQEGGNVTCNIAWWSDAKQQITTGKSRSKHGILICAHITDRISSNVSICLMFHCTHSNCQGLPDLFVAHQLNVSIFIVMNLKHLKVRFSLAMPEHQFPHTRKKKNYRYMYDYKLGSRKS